MYCVRRNYSGCSQKVKLRCNHVGLYVFFSVSEAVISLLLASFLTPDMSKIRRNHSAWSSSVKLRYNPTISAIISVGKNRGFHSYFLSFMMFYVWWFKTKLPGLSIKICLICMFRPFFCGSAVNPSTPCRGVNLEFNVVWWSFGDYITFYVLGF